MAVTGAKKAALLLMSLDPPAAAELLKAAEPAMVKEIAAELLCLRMTGSPEEVSRQQAMEFFSLLVGSGGRDAEGFVKDVLARSLGADRVEDAMAEVQTLVQSRDPFRPIRSARVVELASALSGESPQVAAMVLSELPPARSAELVTLLGDDVRMQAIRGMASCEAVSPETRVRVANAVRRRLDALGDVGETNLDGERRRQQYRKVAVLLRSLSVDMRDALVKSVSEQDPRAAESIGELMVIWEDLPIMGDRAMQEILRGVNSKKLALALVGADEAIIGKIRQNISERASAMLDEEAALLSSPKQEEIDEGREEILKALREQNKKGELTFEEA